MEQIIDVAFWASLRREEGFVPLLSLTFVDPADVREPLRFEAPLALQPQPLTRVAPAVVRPGIHLGIWYDADGLSVWGAARNLPAFCFVLEVVAPGVLVLKQSPADEKGKYVNVAVLLGDQIKVIDERATAVPDCPELLTSLMGFDGGSMTFDPTDTLVRIAVSMRAHGRGGLLLVVPSDTDHWRESVLHPIRYAVTPPFSALAKLIRADEERQVERKWQDAVEKAIEGIAGLTAVDGATILTDRYELLAFGAKIVRRPRHPQTDRVILTEPVEGSTAEIVDPAQLGGTRHLSAAQFAHDQQDAFVLAASQDGRFTVFAWSPCENMVHAHRIETLLL